MIEFEGERYRDDRMFVLYIAPCRLDPPKGGMATTNVIHEGEQEGERDAYPDSDFLWAVVTYRNTERYPAVRVDHFSQRVLAEHFVRVTEPQTPLISRNGKCAEPPLSPQEWNSLKQKLGWREYDYREMFSSGGENAREMLITPASSITIYRNSDP
jgi:hypothetical protein